jgi:hypothetical protein
MGKRRRSHRDLRPETVTGTDARWTGIKDARARMRFQVGDRVAWVGDSIRLGEVAGFVDDDACSARIRWEDGSEEVYPTISARLRHAPRPMPSGSVAETVERHPLEGGRTPSELEPIGARIESGYYASVGVEDDGQSGDLTEIFDATQPEDNRRTRGGR